MTRLAGRQRNGESAAERVTRHWDGFDAYLFDIDGTLLNCRDAVHYFAFCNALSSVAGRPLNLDGVQTHGNTDIGIMADALRLAGVEEAAWRPRLAEMCESLRRGVARDEQEMRAEAVGGAREALEYLRSRGALLGVATGNLEAIGWTKLRRAGLDGFFDFGGFSDHAPTRPEVFAAAVQQARVRRGPDVTICVVGDTPADITAARSNGLAVIAVATGPFSVEELEPHGPTWCVPALTTLFAPVS